MILLASASDLLRLVTSGAPDIDVHVSYADISGSTITPGRTNTKISSAATTTIAGSPAVSTYRSIRTITARNVHAATSNDVTLVHTDGVNSVELIKATLAAGECLYYHESAGFWTGTSSSAHTHVIADVTDLQTELNGKADAPVNNSAVVYVSKVGLDADNGLSILNPKLTIGAAITAASALLTAGAPEVTISVVDGGTYTENITLLANMNLDASGAILVGSISAESDTRVCLNEHYPSVNNQIAYDKSGGTGHGFYNVDKLDLRGTGGALTGCQGIANTSNGSVSFVKVGVLFVCANGIGIGDNASGFGHIHFWAADLYLAGNTAYGINATTANSNIIGYIDHILETGTPTGTIGIRITNASAIVKATITEIIADEAYNISAGDLYLVNAKLTGSRTGTPVFEMSPATAVLLNAANTFTAANTISTNGAASTPAFKLTGTPYTGGTATTTKPHLLIEPTGATSAGWNTGGTMLGINAATGFGGHLIMGQINGSTRFSVEASGGNVYSSGSMTIGASQPLTWNGRASLYSEAAGILQIGLDAAAPAEATYKGADARSGTDTNTVGGILNIAAGRGTGTAAGGTLNLQTSTPTTSGTGAGTLTTRVAITEASVTISLPEINSTNGAASISARKLSGTVFTGGTGTTTYPLDLIASSGVTMPTTWSTSGTMQGIVAPTGFAGNFAHYSVNGAAAVYTVSSAGIVTASRFVDSSGIMGIWSGTIRVGTACNFSFSSTTGYTGATDAGLARNAAGVVEVNSGTNGTLRDLKARNVIIDNTLQLKGFTVATLPAGTVGMRAYVTDATAPTYNGALTGGGAVTIPVFYNGAAWVSA